MSSFTHRINQWIKSQGLFRTLLIIFLVSLCVVEIRAIVLDLKQTNDEAQQYIKYSQGHFQRLSDAITPSEIQPWMTFSYLNFVFKLPVSYLQNTLHISDTRYPNIQISRYARMNHLNLSQFLNAVQQAVTNYKS